MKKISPRVLRIGDIVTPKGGKKDEAEVVRKVEVVVTLANGAQDVYQTNEKASFIEQEEIEDLSEEVLKRPDVTQAAQVIEADPDPVEPVENAPRAKDQ